MAGKALIIAEKPSVARDIAAALGGFRSEQRGAFWESDAYVCTFAVGHLLELKEPDEIDPQYRRWRLADLPIVPECFERRPIKEHTARISLIAALMARGDVEVLINACDAAREGELIFRELVAYAGCRKWVRRLWLQSMTPEAIRHGFDHLRDAVDFDGLGDAAFCRAQADWLIGMNATRAFSLKLRHSEDRHPWSVGRVQTPTLALLVDRELAILRHVPRDYSQVEGTFVATDHEYNGRYCDPTFKADPLDDEAKDDRIFDAAVARRLAASVLGKVGEARETRDETKRSAPRLFNLTGLQKYLGSRYKWTAKHTLEVAQRCYEQHKVITYPRTNATVLPSDYRPEVKRLWGVLADVPAYSGLATKALRVGFQYGAHLFSDAGVDDHFALIPTGKWIDLHGDDGRLLDAVIRRFLAAFYPPARYDRVRRTTIVDGHHFRTGPLEVLKDPGYLEVWGKEAKEELDASLPPLLHLSVTVKNAEIRSCQTHAPARLSEPGLLSLMEHAGRQLDDEALAKVLMSAEGLGTAATRADIIQNLKTKGYVDALLQPTYKGIFLVTTLRRMEAHRLLSAELTARLEMQLAEVERCERPSRAFMGEIKRYVVDVVESARRLDLETLFRLEPPVGGCPRCETKGQVFELSFGYSCRWSGAQGGCGYWLPKNVEGRYLERAQVVALLSRGESSEFELPRTATGRAQRGKFVLEDGRLALEMAGRRQFFTSVQAPPRRSGAVSGGEQGVSPQSNSKASPPVAIGPCRIHKDCSIVETAKAFVCVTRFEGWKRKDTGLEGFFLPKLLCGRTMTIAEALSLATLKDESSPEFGGFLSRSGRTFNARLRCAPDGSFLFDFATGGRSANGTTEQGEKAPKPWRRRKRRISLRSSPRA